MKPHIPKKSVQKGTTIETLRQANGSPRFAQSKQQISNTGN